VVGPSRQISKTLFVLLCTSSKWEGGLLYVAVIVVVGGGGGGGGGWC
jgi:hypothetical protein